VYGTLEEEKTAPEGSVSLIQVVFAIPVSVLL